VNARNGRDRPRLIGYLRVSTAEQAQEGISLDAQEARLRAYVEAHEFDLAAIESDAGVSGKRMANRAALQRALAALKAGDADGLIVLKLDRLSRSIKDVIELVERSEHEGWRLVSLAEHLDTSNAVGRFTVHLLGALAQLEREQIGERTRTALAELRRQGRRISGSPPFGYRFDDGRVVRDDAEQRVLRRILALAAEGRGSWKVTQLLNADAGANPRTGRPWAEGTVRSILATARA